MTRLANWEQVEKATGVKPEGLLNAPQMPDNLEYLWQEYIDIRKGCDQLSYIVIDAYQDVMGYELSPFEIDLLLEVDLLRRTSG